MINRLVAQNMIKTPFKGEPYFSINKKLLAYSQQQSIKLKGFNKDIKDTQIITQNNSKIKNFTFSNNHPWLNVIVSNEILQIYEVSGQSCDKTQKILTIKGVSSVKQSLDAFILTCSDSYFRVLPFQVINQLKQANQITIQFQTLYALHKITPNSSIIQSPECSNIYIKEPSNCISSNSSISTQNNIFVFSHNPKSNKFQKTLLIDYIHNPIAIYRNRYILQLVKENKTINKHNIEIYDINESKLIGKLNVEGELRFVKIRQNMLLLIMNVENIDNYWLLMLNGQPDDKSPLITYKVIYQKGKGDYYDFFNMKTQEALSLNDKKKRINDDLAPEKLDESTSSIIYVLNKQKEKAQVIKFQHSKLLESPFFEEKIQKKMVSNTIKNKIDEEKQNQSPEMQRTRIKSSLEHKSHGKTLQETQKKFVQAIVDTKIKMVLKKFQQLEQRVQKLQKTIKGIYDKIEQNSKDLSRKEIKQSVQSLFQQLTPQFQKYFSELFKQVSGVLDQGVNFYNKKLAAEADIHKQALNEIVVKTFESTKEIIEISKKEEKLSERTQKSLNDLLESKTKWQKKTQEFQQQNKQLTFSTRVLKEPAEGKVFIRADLNSSARKQT